MLRTFFVLLLIATPVIHSFAGKSGEVIPEYQIIKNEKDGSLTNKEAVFVFRFTNIPANSKIKASANDKQKEVSTNSESKFTFKTVPGKFKFQLFYTKDYFEIYTDSIQIEPGYRIEIDVYFMSSLYPVIMDKPVIYCYPQEKTNIHIDLGLKGNMLFTYPTYNNGWDFTAEPNGNIQSNGKQYKYLFWEGETKINYSTTKWNEGTIVYKEELLVFLEESLSQMGMNTGEQQDFITYWYPLMQKNDKTYIHFVFNNDYNEYASMNISPKPDNILRVYMLWTNAEEMQDMHLTKQTIPTLKREGFTLVEWGGSRLPEIPSDDI